MARIAPKSAVTRCEGAKPVFKSARPKRYHSRPVSSPIKKPIFISRRSERIRMTSYVIQNGIKEPGARKYQEASGIVVINILRIFWAFSGDIEPWLAHTILPEIACVMACKSSEIVATYGPRQRVRRSRSASGASAMKRGHHLAACRVGGRISGWGSEEAKSCHAPHNAFTEVEWAYCFDKHIDATDHL